MLTSVPTRPVLSTARTASSDNIARLRAIIDEDIDEAEAHGLEMPLYCKHGWLLAIRTPCWSCDSASDSPAVLRNMLWGEYDDALQEREEREAARRSPDESETDEDEPEAEAGAEPVSAPDWLRNPYLYMIDFSISSRRRVRRWNASRARKNLSVHKPARRSRKRRDPSLVRDTGLGRMRQDHATRGKRKGVIMKAKRRLAELEGQEARRPHPKRGPHSEWVTTARLLKQYKKKRLWSRRPVPRCTARHEAIVTSIRTVLRMEFTARIRTGGI